TLTSGCVSPLRGCRCEVQNAKKMGKCNADFGASFRCLSQLNTVARQIPWGTCKTAPAPNVNFFLCRSRSLVFSLGMGIVWFLSDTGTQPILLKRYRCLNGAGTDTFIKKKKNNNYD